MPILAFLFARMGLNLSATAIKLLMLGFAVLVVVGVIFAGYRHFENERIALIASTRLAAQQEMQAAFAQKSEQLTRESQERQAKAMTVFNGKIAAQNATLDQLQDQIQDIPDEQPEPKVIVAAPVVPDTAPSHPSTSYGELAHVQASPRRSVVSTPAAPSLLPDVNGLNASLDRMLERATR